MELLNQGFDHVEYVLHDIRPMESVFLRMGFEKIGERTLVAEGTQSSVYAQGHVRAVLTQAIPSNTGGSPLISTDSYTPPKSEALKFLHKHAEGICVLAVEVKDATQTFNECVKRGARPALEPKTFKSNDGTVVRAEIWTPGSVRYAFIERKAFQGAQGAALFDEELTVSRLESPSPLGIHSIDHLTNNVGMGEMKEWVKFYKEVFGFVVTRHFDIRTGRTGLISDVVESADRKVKVPINEATEATSQVQEFVDRMKGAGVQHLALRTTDIQHTLQSLRKQSFKFLSVPHTYYETVPTRVPGVTESLAALEELGILLDGEEKGYLLQVFSEEVLGPFFFEYIQRKGNEGFGEGNFRALFEAIERDQIKRGVLKA
ncbi:MAG: 4-hydroxyphenylpyruvate dioxygenase [Bdellovibrionia bacterium]